MWRVIEPEADEPPLNRLIAYILAGVGCPTRDCRDLVIPRVIMYPVHVMFQRWESTRARCYMYGWRPTLITYLETSIFNSPAQTLVNTVNVEGVMGKGIAKGFKARYPKMFLEYKRVCDHHELSIGDLHLWRGERRWVLNFPTKTTWRQPSRLEYIEAGLRKFVDVYARLGITSISFPLLGCGNGNLDWRDVKPIMETYLRRVNVVVYVHEVQVAADFVPEHLEKHRAPDDFSSFWRDIVGVVQKHKGAFYTSTDGPYVVDGLTSDYISINKSGSRRRIDREIIEESWLSLRDRCLTMHSFPDDNSRKLKSYVFPIIAELPYVQRVPVREGTTRTEGLFIDRESFDGYAREKADNAQGCLSL
jgi:O-acetyl-ADP-ribose deacetylase (regulator of RNase III)